MVARSGFSSATSGVTASTEASGSRRSAACTNRVKSAGRHQASTVEMSAGPGSSRSLTARKLSREDRVVRTMKSTSSAGNPVRSGIGRN